MSRTKIIVATFAAVLAGLAARTNSAAQSAPHVSDTDRIRLREAVRLADKLGDTIWPKWSSAPFATILVTPDYEYLIRQPKPSPDFAPLSGS